MLDWSNYKKPINLDIRLDIEKIYREIAGDKIGICHIGGNYSHVVIQTENIGIKIYKPNEKKILKLIKFHEKYKDSIFKNFDHIQKVYEIKKGDKFYYSLQEWVNGDTLLQRFNNKKLSICELNLILNQFYLNIIIPFWSKGIIWLDGCLSNLCLNEKLIMIDTDNMYKTCEEIIHTPYVYNLRDKARLKNMINHLDFIYHICLIIKYIDKIKFTDLYSKLKYIYTSSINEEYFDKSVECFTSFLADLNKILK
jgi:hypothetical protein